jgi:hypothetical protein
VSAFTNTLNTHSIAFRNEEKAYLDHSAGG